jgi:hypothetical protein
MVSFMTGSGWVFEVGTAAAARLAGRDHGWHAAVCASSLLSAPSSGCSVPKFQHAMQQKQQASAHAFNPCLSPPPTCLPLPARPQEPAALAEPGRPRLRCRCSVPTHTTLAEGTDCAGAAAQMAAAGLHYPLLAKPLWADGREGSHALAGAPRCMAPAGRLVSCHALSVAALVTLTAVSQPASQAALRGLQWRLHTQPCTQMRHVPLLVWPLPPPRPPL